MQGCLKDKHSMTLCSFRRKKQQDRLDASHRHHFLPRLSLSPFSLRISQSLSLFKGNYCVIFWCNYGDLQPYITSQQQQNMFISTAYSMPVRDPSKQSPCGDSHDQDATGLLTETAVHRKIIKPWGKLYSSCLMGHHVAITGQALMGVDEWFKVLYLVPNELFYVITVH